MIYSAGPCAVCASAGDALIVRAAGNARVFFVCPGCGCAWGEPPVAGDVATIERPEVFAPAGFALASLAQIRAAAGGAASRLSTRTPTRTASTTFPGSRRRASRSTPRRLANVPSLLTSTLRMLASLALG